MLTFDHQRIGTLLFCVSAQNLNLPGRVRARRRWKPQSDVMHIRILRQSGRDKKSKIWRKNGAQMWTCVFLSARCLGWTRAWEGMRNSCVCITHLWPVRTWIGKHFTVYGLRFSRWCPYTNTAGLWPATLLRERSSWSAWRASVSKFRSISSKLYWLTWSLEVVRNYWFCSAKCPTIDLSCSDLFVWKKRNSFAIWMHRDIGESAAFSEYKWVFV